MAQILATGVRESAHIVELDSLIEKRMSEIPTERLLVYFIDTVQAEALPYLAEQFNVLGIRGYTQAETEQEKRDLIKRAIELHRYKGTPWAVREAVKSAGFYDAEIIEGVGLDHNGTILRNGVQRHEGGNPFNFRVRLDLGNEVGITAEKLNLARQVINEYKNVRSWLFDIGFIASMSTDLPIDDDELNLIPTDIVVDNLNAKGAYDASISYSGSNEYSYATDVVSLNISNLGTENF